MGLVTPSARSAGGFRLYTHGDVERLRTIRRMKPLGFTLEEIGELLTLDAGDDRARARALAEARVAALDERIAALTRARDALTSLAGACARGGAGPCPILASFDR